MHKGTGGGHFGVSRVQHKLCGKYFWPSMVEDVKHFIKTCKRCQKMNRSGLKPKVSLKPIPVPPRILAQIGMDLIHMNPCKGYKYIVTAVDYLSKYCEMRPLREKSAKEVAKFIYEDLICRSGCSEYHITDQGREFVNSTNRHLLELCGMKQRITSSYHPQANGLSERMNRSSQESLAKSLTDEKDWVEMIPTIALPHRSSMNASTRVSPLEMILGHKPMVPVNIHMKYPTDEELGRDLTRIEVEEIEHECLEYNIQQMKRVKEAAIGRAKVNIANAQTRYKRNYDKRFANKEDFKVGDRVLLENQINKNRKGSKRAERFSGPYEIIEISDVGNCTLRHEEGEIKKRKHPLAHLKLYNERNLVVESDSEEVEEIYRKMKDVEGDGSSDVYKLLEHFDKEEVKTGREEDVTGAQVTGAPFEVNDDFTGGQEKDTPKRVQEARRRLSLSLKKMKAPENLSHPKTVKKSNQIEFVDSILIESSDSSHASDVEYYEPDDNQGTGPAQYVFIPIGTGTRCRLAPLFGINRMGPLPNYSGMMKVCNGMPSRIKTITGDGNCLFNSISYVLCSSEKFNWEIRQKLCSYIEKN